MSNKSKGAFMRSFLLSSFLTLALVGCGLVTVPSEKSATTNPVVTTASGSQVLTAADTGKTIDLAAGRSFLIDLESNISTGYRWNLVTEPDQSILRFMQSDYQEPSTKTGQTGVPGQETWQFQAVRSGTTNLKLVYAHSWEIAQSTEREFTLTVRVK